MNLSWVAFKTKFASGSDMIYSIESEYRSNDSSDDIDRYWIRADSNGITYETFIRLESSPNNDQIDFDSNFKSQAIAI